MRRRRGKHLRRSEHGQLSLVVTVLVIILLVVVILAVVH